MRYLTQGSQTPERLQLLLGLTRIASDNVKDALADHLVRGLSDAMAASLNGISQQNFKRALDTLDKVAASIEQIKEMDWRHLKSVK